MSHLDYEAKKMLIDRIRHSLCCLTDNLGTYRVSPLVIDNIISLLKELKKIHNTRP